MRMSHISLIKLVRQIDGDVYDVSKGAAYQPGGSYYHLWVPMFPETYLDFQLALNSVGLDAARAFGTGCFQTHRTHDTRGMSEKELKVSP